MLKKIACSSLSLLLLSSPLVSFAQTDDTPQNGEVAGIYCPQLSTTFQRGARDATTNGQVSELQAFLTDYFELSDSLLIGGFFGNLTQKYVVKFQSQQGLPAYGIVGSLTRAKIAEACKSVSDFSTTQLQSKREQVRRALYSFEPALVGQLTSLILKIRGSTRTDIPNARAFADKWGDKMISLSQLIAGIPKLHLESLTSTELDIILSQLAEIQQLKSSVLAAYNAVPPGELENLYATTAEAQAQGRDARRRADIKQLQLALELYYDSHSTYPAQMNASALVTPGFISGVPVDPQTGAAYLYAGLGAGSCNGYHMGAVFEIASASALSNDADAQMSAVCPGSNNDFVGTDPIYDVKETTSFAGNTGVDSIQKQDVTVGTGKIATRGASVSVLYVGKLQDGTIFDSSQSHGNTPLTFTLGAPGLIEGFQQGVEGMREGGERLIAIPPSLGYGTQAVKDVSGKVVIPANSTLVFDLKLVTVGGGTTAATLGTYHGYMNGSSFITTPNITRADALANCMLNASNNLGSSIRCTWNDEEIYSRPPATASTNVIPAHVVGVYEGSPHSTNHSETTVNVSLNGSMQNPILVLASYEPVNWMISNLSGVTLSKVITLGYYDQHVVGLASSVPIENHSYVKDGTFDWNCAYANYETNGGCSYNSMKNWLFSHGYSVAHFYGNYTGGSFNVNFSQ